jgi:hypothetical protein
MSIVSWGKRRGLSSAGTPRAAVLPASSSALSVNGVPGAVPREREQRDARAALGGAPREARERERAGRQRRARGARHAEGDEPAPAGRDVPRRGEELDLRGRHIHGDRIGGDGAVVHAERTPEVVARPHLEGGGALAEPERRALDRQGKLDAPPERALLPGHGRGLHVLHDADLDARDVPAARLQRDLERRLLADEARRGRERLDARHRLAPREVGHRADDGEQEGEDQEDAELHAGRGWHGTK